MQDQYISNCFLNVAHYKPEVLAALGKKLLALPPEKKVVHAEGIYLSIGQAFICKVKKNPVNLSVNILGLIARLKGWDIAPECSDQKENIDFTDKALWKDNLLKLFSDVMINTSVLKKILDKINKKFLSEEVLYTPSDDDDSLVHSINIFNSISGVLEAAEDAGKIELYENFIKEYLVFFMDELKVPSVNSGEIFAELVENISKLKINNAKNLSNSPENITHEEINILKVFKCVEQAINIVVEEYLDVAIELMNTQLDQNFSQVNIFGEALWQQVLLFLQNKDHQRVGEFSLTRINVEHFLSIVEDFLLKHQNIAPKCVAEKMPLLLNACIEELRCLETEISQLTTLQEKYVKLHKKINIIKSYKECSSESALLLEIINAQESFFKRKLKLEQQLTAYKVDFKSITKQADVILSARDLNYVRESQQLDELQNQVNFFIVQLKEFSVRLKCFFTELESFLVKSKDFNENLINRLACQGLDFYQKNTLEVLQEIFKIFVAPQNEKIDFNKKTEIIFIEQALNTISEELKELTTDSLFCQSKIVSSREQEFLAFSFWREACQIDAGVNEEVKNTSDNVQGISL